MKCSYQQQRCCREITFVRFTFDDMSETCIFQTLYACEKRKDFITKVSRDRLKKVRDLSIDVYQNANISHEIATDDGIDDCVLQETMHKQCVDTYTHYKSVKKRKAYRGGKH